MKSEGLYVATTYNFLTIAGKSKDSKISDFDRTLSLLEIADTDKVKESFRNGILTVSMPKKIRKE